MSNPYATHKYKCSVCKKSLEGQDAYEYRGVFSCEEHFDQVTEARDYQRNQIIAEESAKTEKFRGLDLSNSSVGKANKEILRADIEIASKESQRLKDYERPGEND